MPIAVLSNNISFALDWLRTEYKITKVNMMYRTATDDKGIEYVVVTQPEHIYGMRFADYIRSPDYFPIEDMIKSRIF